AVHSVLTGEATAEDALLDLEDELVDITGFETGPPPDANVEASGGTLTGDGAAPSAAGAEFLTRDYEGATITFFGGEPGPRDIALGELITSFEEQTGITVNVVAAPESATDNLAQQLQ